MNTEFAVHKLNTEGMKKAKLIAQSFDHLLDTLETICIQGRELSIARTKLEEACFFAKKAMAINLSNQELESCTPYPMQPMGMNAPDEKFNR